MTQSNVQIVRRLADLMWIARDLDAAFELVHPEAVFDWSASRSPYSGLVQGHAAIREACLALWDAWEEWNPEFEEVIQLDRDSVLIVTFVRARGKGSGVPVEAHGASLWSVRDGRIVYARLFQSKQEALDSVGFSRAEPG